MKTTLKYQKINKDSKFEKPEIEESTGALLLKSAQSGRIAGHQTANIKTGVAIEIPDGQYGLLISPDNPLGNDRLTVRTKTVTIDQREELVIQLVNSSPYPEPVAINQVIGKLLLCPVQELMLKGVAKLKQEG